MLFSGSENQQIYTIIVFPEQSMSTKSFKSFSKTHLTMISVRLLRTILVGESLISDVILEHVLQICFDAEIVMKFQIIMKALTR